LDYSTITQDKYSEGDIQMLEKDQLPATRVILQSVETATFSDGRSESFFWNYPNKEKNLCSIALKI